MKKFVSLSTGVRIEYVEQGKGDGVPVIFLHGVTDSWRSFERMLPLLPPDIHAFALSQRGHGDSSRPTSGYRLAVFAKLQLPCRLRRHSSFPAGCGFWWSRITEILARF